jgi:hypothetical protein
MLAPASRGWFQGLFNELFLDPQLAPIEAITSPEDVFGPAPRISAPSSTILTACSPNLAENLDSEGCLILDQVSLPVVDDLETLSVAFALSPGRDGL